MVVLSSRYVERREIVTLKAWQLGSPGTLIYSVYDALRRRLNGRLVRYLISCRPESANCIVLEAGSGTAYASSILCRDPSIGLSVAMDIDSEALHEARKRDPHLCVVVADLTELPFRSGSIDITWNSSTIEHLPEPMKALLEMTRVTKSGGKVFVGVPNVHGPLGIQRLVKTTRAGEWIGQTFALRDVRNMVRVVGLSPVDSFFYFFRFFVGVLGQKP